MTYPPNAIDVDEHGCSCTTDPRPSRRYAGSDPACPRHGMPLRHGDGDVLVNHPDGSTTIIKEPTA